MAYLIVQIILFYAGPLICAAVTAPAAIYNALPAVDMCVAMAAGFFFGKNRGTDWLISLESALIFVPCLYIFFNTTAWIYVPLIGVASLLCVLIGNAFRTRFKR